VATGIHLLRGLRVHSIEHYGNRIGQSLRKEKPKVFLASLPQTAHLANILSF